MAHLKETEIDGPTPNLVRNRRRRAYYFYATGVNKHRLGNRQGGTRPTLERAQGKLTTSNDATPTTPWYEPSLFQVGRYLEQIVSTDLNAKPHNTQRLRTFATIIIKDSSFAIIGSVHIFEHRV